MEKVQESIKGFLENYTGKFRILILSGDNCKWCQLLKEKLADQVLQNHCWESDIAIEWFTLEPKPQELEETKVTGKPGPRTIYNVKTIPTFVLIGPKEEIIDSTEFLDDCQPQGGKAYLNWLKPRIQAYKH